YRPVAGFEATWSLMRDTAHLLNIVRCAGNCFRKNKIHTMLGSAAEVEVARQCYGTMWPAGINLYGILREMYPLFHARLTGQIPAWVAAHMDSFIEDRVERRMVRGIGRVTVGDDGRFLGLHPVARVPAAEVTLDSSFVSQDQLGRRAIAERILYDAREILQRDANQALLVIDYAGGVGNISELLLKSIYALPQDEMKQRLMNMLRVAVIDIAEDQLAAGRNRFSRMGRQADLAGIGSNIIFLRGDVTARLGGDTYAALQEKFGAAFGGSPLCLGMTSYTIGALDNLTGDDGTTYSQAMADRMRETCWRLYAVDFSSPMWRQSDFLADTGRWGREYLRAMHGVADAEDERRRANRMMKAIIKMRYGGSIETVGQLVRFFAAGPGLAAHYDTVWPGSDGHNSGYSVLEDDMLKKPGVLSFAERLQQAGSRVAYKSKVWLFCTSDLGSTAKGMRAWSFMPGWVADFAVAENEQNAPGAGS
ncbi:MAG: hypothetical protein GY868_21090, partial [Deltaproteobacteria bacterium]|nr:hypothetical protein [Deltaproteobacteria bacterium]